ncbi:MAG: hypothetical protein ABIH03_15190, partial [Pseudomonadota bacterium]
MSDENMRKEFPDAEQRAAVCNQKWRDKDKEDMARARCADQHFGHWWIDHAWMSAAVAAYKAGALPRAAASGTQDSDGLYRIYEGVA